MFNRLCRQDPPGSAANACNVSLKGAFGPRHLYLEAITALASQEGKGVEATLGLTAPACRIWSEDSFLEFDTRSTRPDSTSDASLSRSVGIET